MEENEENEIMSLTKLDDIYNKNLIDLGEISEIKKRKDLRKPVENGWIALKLFLQNENFGSDQVIACL